VQTTAFWSSAQAASSLIQLACLERSLAHLRAGWIAKIATFDGKLMLGLHMHHSMERASYLRSRIYGLCNATRDEPVISTGWRVFMSHVDQTQSSMRLLAAVYQFLYPRLIELYKRHVCDTDPDGDRGSVELIRSFLSPIEDERRQGLNLLPVNARNNDSPWLCEIQDLWDERMTGEPLSLDEAIWRPVDRVHAAVRPEGMNFSEFGSYGLLPVDPLYDPQDIGSFLHVELDEEYTTLELIARNSYEHPDMPWQFHRDMARQASDEARHAQLITRLLASRGFRHGDFEVSTSSYDSLYEFEPCAPGSRQELLWRMLIRQTFMEGLALDNLAFEIRRRQAAGQTDIAAVFEYILRDEVFHAQSGLRWSRELLDSEPQAMVQARQAAVRYYTERAETIREHFVLNNLDKAMEELEAVEAGKQLRGGRAPDRPINLTGRKQAGFTDQDIQQVIAWGYAVENS